MIPVTILMSTSPVKSNPSTAIIDQSIQSVRELLPDAPLIIMADGMPDHPGWGIERMAAYEGFKDKLRGRYDNTCLLEYSEHLNQAGMLGRGLELVKTPLILYGEHDWTYHHGIEWEKIAQVILDGTFDLVRLYMNHRVHPLHEGMFHDRVIHHGVPFITCSQWSQNPHVASTDFYRRLHDKYLVGQRDAIENILHSPCACGPWSDWKLAVYNPLHDSSMGMVRHLDGREGER